MLSGQAQGPDQTGPAVGPAMQGCLVLRRHLVIVPGSSHIRGSRLNWPSTAGSAAQVPFLRSDLSDSGRAIRLMAAQVLHLCTLPRLILLDRDLSPGPSLHRTPVCVRRGLILFKIQINFAFKDHYNWIGGVF